MTGLAVAIQGIGLSQSKIFLGNEKRQFSLKIAFDKKISVLIINNEIRSFF